MAKTSSENVLQIQTEQEEGSPPPLISDEGVHHQTAESKGCVCEVGGVDAEDICRIDVSREKVCRICQLGSDQLPPGAGSISLVHLGCSCKGELGFSHYHCAQAWFTQKGNRTCEICGKIVKNIEGIEEKGGGVIISATSVVGMNTRSSSYASDPGCGKLLCNFLLAAMIIVFILPWAFHPSKLS